MTKSLDKNIRWTPGALRKLGRYLKSDLDYRECATLLRCSRNAIIGVVNRHGLKLTTEQALDHKRRANYEREKGGRAPVGKPDRQFIEPWAEYTARKQRERQEKKDELRHSQDVGRTVP